MKLDPTEIGFVVNTGYMYLFVFWVDLNLLTL